MTVLSPELMAGADARNAVVAFEADRQILDPGLVIVLARLNCLACLMENPTQLQKTFEAEIRAEFSYSLASNSWLKNLPLWWSFSSFQKKLRAQTDDFAKDVLMGEFILHNCQVDVLFDPETTWSQLYENGHKKLVEALAGLSSEESLQLSLERIYKNQRDLFVKELLVRVLPTVVLLTSTLIAVVMAAFVWRSLFIAQ